MKNGIPKDYVEKYLRRWAERAGEGAGDYDGEDDHWTLGNGRWRSGACDVWLEPGIVWDVLQPRHKTFSEGLLKHVDA